MTIEGTEILQGGVTIKREYEIINNVRYLLCEAWYINGQYHREGDAAIRRWEIKNNERFIFREYWYYKGKLHTYGMKNDSDGEFYKRGKFVDKETLIDSGKIILRFMRRLRVMRILRRKAISEAITSLGCVVFPGLVELID